MSRFPPKPPQWANKAVNAANLLQNWRKAEAFLSRSECWEMCPLLPSYKNNPGLCISLISSQMFRVPAIEKPWPSRIMAFHPFKRILAEPDWYLGGSQGKISQLIPMEAHQVSAPIKEEGWGCAALCHWLRRGNRMEIQWVKTDFFHWKLLGLINISR